MADKLRLLLLRSSRIPPTGAGVLRSTLVSAFQDPRSPRPLFPVSRRAFSLSSEEVGAVKKDNKAKGQHATASVETSIDQKPLTPLSPPKLESGENPALFQPFSAAEDPSMYEKGTFQYLFENSQFVKAADLAEREVEGEVIAVVGEKVYVDFGCKFHAVVTCPEGARDRCSPGVKVVIMLQDLEVTKHFIGDTKHNSRLEAEAKWVRLL